jgi:peptide/nickel transport system permease protein
VRKDLVQLLLRRALVGGPAALGLVVVTFIMIRLSGQSPVAFLAGPNATQPEIEALTRELRLDRPLLDQLLTYIGHLATGDLGRSWLSGKPVLDELIERLPATLELVVLALVVGGAAGILAGTGAAFRAGGRFDVTARLAAIVSFSIPIYVVGLVAIFLFFYLLGLAPPPLGRISLAVLAPPTVTGSYVVDAAIAGDGPALRSAAAQLLLPVGCFALIVAGPVMKQSRSIVAETLQTEFVGYAVMAGLPRWRVHRMVLRNSFVPIFTFIGMELSHLFAASSLIEFIFAWGGVGQYGLNAIVQGDFAAVQGYVLLLGVFSLLVFLIVDLIVYWAEPRSRRQ